MDFTFHVRWTLVQLMEESAVFQAPTRATAARRVVSPCCSPLRINIGRVPLCIAAAMLVCGASAQSATINSRFNPNDFASNGTLSLVATDTIVFNTLAGTYTINAGTPVAGGVVVTSQSGNVKTMLFNFDNISIASGVTVTVTGDFGLVLGSRENITLSSNISVSGGNGTGTGGSIGAGGPGAEGGSRDAPSFDSNSSPYNTTAGNGGSGNNSGGTSGDGRGIGGGNGSGGAGQGGSYGGVGGNNTRPAYGDSMLTDLYGGSGGSGGSGGNGGGAGAGGGGAIELPA